MQDPLSIFDFTSPSGFRNTEPLLVRSFKLDMFKEKALDHPSNSAMVYLSDMFINS